MKLPSTKVLVGLGLGAGLGAGFGCALLYYANRIEPRKFRTEYETVTIGGGDSQEEEEEEEEKSFRILHISDLHLIYPDSEKIAFLKEVTDDDFDFVFLTGDIFEDDRSIELGSEILTRKPRLGAYAVLGNHDYYKYSMVNKTIGRILRGLRHPNQKRNVEPMVASLTRGGFQVLRHEVASMPREKVHIVGVDYPSISEGKFRELIQPIKKDDLSIVLFHWPRRLDLFEKCGIHMVFGGHTHGGQIRLPGIGPLITDSELPVSQASGVVKRGATTLHISRGLGADPRTNIRINCPPAATIIELKYQPNSLPSKTTCLDDFADGCDHKGRLDHKQSVTHADLRFKRFEN